MAKLVGIDIRSTYVRGVVLRTSYRKIAIEGMAEISVEIAGSLEDALQQLSAHLGQHGDVVATAMSGDAAFLHRIGIPSTALKQLGEVLPFELEAQVPIDIEDLVFDHVLLPHHKGSAEVTVLTAAARTDAVKERIELLRNAMGHEPTRVSVGALPLANLVTLVPALKSPEPIAFIDLADDRTDLLVMMEGKAVFSRTASVGIAGLPDSAPRLAFALRQTLGAWASIEDAPLQQVYLVGGGADAPGAAEYLSAELSVAISPLPDFPLEGLTEEQREQMPRFAKAVGLALGLRGSASDPDLRQGTLSFQRGYGFIKQKAPVFVGVGVALLLSFVFASWAEASALSAQNEVLAAALGKMTKRVLGQEMTDPEEVIKRLEGGGGRQEEDPQPKVDAFDLIVAVSDSVDKAIVHDIDELELARGHVKLQGVVSTTEEAEKIEENLKQKECFQGVKIAKHTRGNNDRQKYELELELRCEEPKKKKSASEEDDEASDEDEGGEE